MKSGREELMPLEDALNRVAAPERAA